MTLNIGFIDGPNSVVNLWLVLVTNDVRQHHFHKQKIYLLRMFSIDPASISVKKGLFHKNNIALHVEIISRFSVSGAHAHWVGSTNTPSHATKELKMR